MRYTVRILLALSASFASAADSIPSWAQAPRSGSPPPLISHAAVGAGWITTGIALELPAGVWALSSDAGTGGSTAHSPFLLGLARCVLAEASPGATEQSSAPNRQGEKSSSEQEESQGFRILKLINFAILAAGLGYLLRKPLESFLRDRADTIRERLEEGRNALQTSESRLKHIEQKLGRLEEEIARFKKEAASEMEAERERLQRSAAEEADKMGQAARMQIEISARAAKLELKAYTAEQAVRLSEELVRRRLDESGRHRLVTQFVEGLDNGRSPGYSGSPDEVETNERTKNVS